MSESTIGRYLAAAGVATCCACAPAAAPGGAGGVRPALLEWQIGINEKGGPSPMLETVLPATFGGRPVWRIVHRDPDPTAGDGAFFDMYDVDRETLGPVRSVMRREGFSLSLSFEGDRVQIDRRDGDQTTTAEVRVRSPMPEGPGDRVLLAALPLRVGYATEFSIVDRWARDDAHRIARVRLTVPRRTRLDTPSGRRDAFEVLLADLGGSFSIRSWLRADPPRYPFRVEYRRGDTALVSEVQRMTVLD